MTIAQMRELYPDVPEDMLISHHVQQILCDTSYMRHDEPPEEHQQIERELFRRDVREGNIVVPRLGDREV